MGNRSLDDFLDADETGADVAAGEGDAAETGIDGTGEGDDADRTAGAGPDDDPAGGGEAAGGPPEADVSVPADDVDPATATYVGRPGECAVCGTTARRRWESDDGLVCPECKAW